MTRWWFPGVVWGAVACGAGEEATSELQCPVVSGEPDSIHAAVVALVDDRGAVQCTGTIVDERHVLTAAHCIVDGAPALRARIDAADSSTSVIVSASTLHPQFAVGPLGSSYSNDVAILELSEPVSVQPLALTRIAPFAGQLVAIVGYGRTAVDCRGNGERRRGDMVVGALSPGAMELQPTPASTCYADSGGPVLVQSDQGAARLLGVVSTGSATCEGTSVATRLDSLCASSPLFSAVCAGQRL
jgi:secreted trypsin-like serine protease